MNCMPLFWTVTMKDGLLVKTRYYYRLSCIARFDSPRPLYFNRPFVLIYTHFRWHRVYTVSMYSTTLMPSPIYKYRDCCVYIYV